MDCEYFFLYHTASSKTRNVSLLYSYRILYYEMPKAQMLSADLFKNFLFFPKKNKTILFSWI
jgi:hypothetical protein